MLANIRLMLTLLLIAALASPSASRVQVLFFTASWCEPCRAVDRVLRELARKHGRRLEVIPIDFDTATAENSRWGVHELPVTVVISNGKVVMRSEGASSRSLAALETAVRKALEDPRTRRKK